MKIILAHKGIDVILKTRYHASVGITSEIDCGNAFKVKVLSDMTMIKPVFRQEVKIQLLKP